MKTQTCPAFVKSQQEIVDSLKRRGLIDRGYLARRGSKVQELVTRIRASGRSVIRPQTIAAHTDYDPQTIQRALTRMLLTGELERLQQGSYRLTWDDDPPADGEGVGL